MTLLSLTGSIHLGTDESPQSYGIIREENILFRAVRYFLALPRIVRFRDGGPFVGRLFESYVCTGEMSSQSCHRIDFRASRYPGKDSENERERERERERHVRETAPRVARDPQRPSKNASIISESR